MWWWCGIFLAVSLVATLFCYEESKYVPLITGSRITATNQAQPSPMGDVETTVKQKDHIVTGGAPELEPAASLADSEPHHGQHKPYS